MIIEWERLLLSLMDVLISAALLGACVLGFARTFVEKRVFFKC